MKTVEFWSPLLHRVCVPRLIHVTGLLCAALFVLQSAESSPPKQYTLFSIASSSHVSLFFLFLSVCVCAYLWAWLCVFWWERASERERDSWWEIWILLDLFSCFSLWLCTDFRWVVVMSGWYERLHSPKIAHLSDEKLSKIKLFFFLLYL